MDARNMFREFANDVIGKRYDEIILIADKAATQAYRNALAGRRAADPGSCEWVRYSETLEGMIRYLRNEVKVRSSDSQIADLFVRIQQSARRE